MSLLTRYPDVECFVRVRVTLRFSLVVHRSVFLRFCVSRRYAIVYDDGYTDSHVRPMMVRRMTNGESSTPSDPNAAWREWRERRRQRRGQGRSSSSPPPPPRGTEAAARQLLQVH